MPDHLDNTGDVPKVEVKDPTFNGIGVSSLPPVDDGDCNSERPTIAILSLGEMGLGIATLLTKFKYPVVTNLAGRSSKTKDRARAAGIQVLGLSDMLDTASIIMSIVPPGEALGLAEIIADSLSTSKSTKDELVYVDLNAVSPDLARQIGRVVNGADMTFIDGAVIGFPPKELEDKTWFRPALTTSGPPLETVMSSPWTQQLVSLLNIRHVADEIGAASGLKMCFGAIYKGHAAVVTQAYTTAESLGVLPALRDHLGEYFPTTKPIVESALFGSQRKAYRWIKEMEEIEHTFAQEGGWSRSLFSGVAEVFRVVAHETNLEQESKADVKEITSEICLALRRRKSI